MQSWISLWMGLVGTALRPAAESAGRLMSTGIQSIGKFRVGPPRMSVPTADRASIEADIQKALASNNADAVRLHHIADALRARLSHALEPGNPARAAELKLLEDEVEILLSHVPIADATARSMGRIMLTGSSLFAINGACERARSLAERVLEMPNMDEEMIAKSRHARGMAVVERFGRTRIVSHDDLAHLVEASKDFTAAGGVFTTERHAALGHISLANIHAAIGNFELMCSSLRDSQNSLRLVPPQRLADLDDAELRRRYPSLMQKHASIARELCPSLFDRENRNTQRALQGAAGLVAISALATCLWVAPPANPPIALSEHAGGRYAQVIATPPSTTLAVEGPLPEHMGG